MSYMVEIFGRALPDTLWPVFRDYLSKVKPASVGRPAKAEVARRTHSHVLAGVTALKQSSGAEAKLHFDRAISNRDRTPAAIVGMACALDMLGQAHRARRYLKLAMQKYPDDAKLQYAMGLLEERSGQPDRALPLYQHSIYFQPHQRSARFRLMALALAKADYATALPQAEAIATQNPLELPAWTRLGGLHLLADDPMRAIQSFEQALKLLADNWQSQPDDVIKDAQTGNVDDTIERLERTIASGQNYADLHVRLGDLYNKRGRTEDALEEFKQALRLNPYYLEATTKVAANYIQAHQSQEAALWLGRALEINEAILMAYVGLGLAHAYTGKDKESRSDLDLARGIASNAPVLMTEIVRLHADDDGRTERVYASDRHRQARSIHRGELLKRSIQTHMAWLTTNPDDASTWLRVGMLLEADRQAEAAADAYAKAVEISPGCTFALVRLGLADNDTSASATSGMLRRVFWPEKIDLDTHYGLSVLFSQVQRFDLTAEKFGEGLSKEQNESFWRNVALSLEEMGMLNRPKSLWQALGEIRAPSIGTVGQPQSSQTNSADSL
jgi:tetratricopeptide (TPR) repeat protein